MQVQTLSKLKQNDSTMLGFRLFLCLTCAVAVTNSCLIPDKKEDQEVHVFHIDSKDADTFEIHIPADGRKKRAISKNHEYATKSCDIDDDCPPGAECLEETSQCHYPLKRQASSKPETQSVYLIPIN